MALWKQVAETLSVGDDAVVASVIEEFYRIVGFRACFACVFRWPRSMAQYAVGHQQRLAQIRQHAAAPEELALAANACTGIGAPD